MRQPTRTSTPKPGSSSIELSPIKTLPPLRSRRSPESPAVFKHVILLPEWLNDYLGANQAEIYFKLEPLAGLIAQLVDLNVCCVVLDWELKPMPPEKVLTELPYHLKHHQLGGKTLFVVDTIRHADFIKQASWRRVISVAQAHYGIHSSEGLPRLHVHDATSYLRRDNFNFQTHRIDGLILPDNACRNLCTARAERCQPTEQIIEALHNYLQMLYENIRKERIIELQQQRQAKRLAMQVMQRERAYEVVETIDIGCGACKRQMQRRRVVHRGPLFVEAQRSGAQKPRSPQSVLKGLGAAAADFAGAVRRHSPAA